MKILICDDERDMIDKYKIRLEEIGKKFSVKIETLYYASGEFMLISREEWINQVSIIYLDIQINSLSGIDLAKRIRDLGYDGEIVFFARSKNFAYEAYEVFPTSYILKNQLYDESFEKIFYKCLTNIEKQDEENFILKYGQGSVIIPLKDINYFEINKKLVTLNYLDNKMETFYSNLNTLEEKLKRKGFLRIHRSYLVNTDKIYKFTGNNITLNCGINIPIGRTYIKKVSLVLNKLFNL
ncbi:MAG: LytR/AlgR family response regulator transcription factor [Clostridium chrysemydis]|uniref:LytR/AlgR family response regulator transcription factor n=1 Tax=Clostridium TaxID=1485 RepID=UPI0021533EBF|nr:LytTR family DNA-binding domain-containing protein [Clostridium sp. LY3-2]MCR6515732.1 LytTR family DNA-binding domain-containing protein [Clostridium sp. LY3-2]